jgi:hypothetical protein
MLCQQEVLMSKVGKIIVGAVAVVAGVLTGNFALAVKGAALVGSTLFSPKGGKRRASETTLEIGEVPRQAIVGRAATAGSLVDAFNFGGKYGTDWELLILALADHQSDALEGFYVNDSYVNFAGDGDVAGYNGQLKVWFRNGAAGQQLPSVVLTNGACWTSSDRGTGISYVVVAYKADATDAKNPVWSNGRPSFLWVLRGALCYDPRKDSTVGGSGNHRWNDPTTREWSENAIVCRYNFVRGFYAENRVGQPDQLLVGRGLSAVEAPPSNLFHRANLCDEAVDGESRYRVGGIIQATETFIEVENDFAAACAGTIVQPEGAVEIDPGEARAAVVTITDRDLVVGSKVKRRWFPSVNDRSWINTVLASYIEPQYKWSAHTAPVRRDPADIVADRAPREESLQLGFVTWIKQAGRVAEISRRLGRLFVRTEIVLPPRFAELEEGDWIIWQSDRYLKGQALTFRIDAWGSDRAWHHSLVLRQISASCYSDTAPLTNGSVAISQPDRGPIGAPLATEWTLEAGQLDAGDIRTPALIVTGASTNTSANFVRMEYTAGASAPTAATVWNDLGVSGPDVKRREIPVAPGGTYWLGISYSVNGIQGERLLLGPVTALSITYPNGSPIQDLSPNIAAAAGMGPALNQNSAFDVYDADNQPVGWGVFNGSISRRANTSQSTRGSDALNINGVVFAFGEPFNVYEGQALWLEGRAYCTANATVGAAPTLAAYLAYLDGVGNNTGQTAFALNAPVAAGTAVQALPTKTVVPAGSGIKKAQWRFYTGGNDAGAEIVLDYLAAYSSEPAATVGAQTGANLRDASGMIITDPAIMNSRVAIPFAGANLPNWRVAGNTIEKITAGWNSGIHSPIPLGGTAVVRARLLNSSYAMIGITTFNSTLASYEEAIDFKIYANSASGFYMVGVGESYTQTTQAIANGDVVEVNCNARSINFLVNGSPIASPVPISIRLVWFPAFAAFGSAIFEEIHCGPFTDDLVRDSSGLALNDAQFRNVDMRLTGNAGMLYLTNSTNANIDAVPLADAGINALAYEAQIDLDSAFLAEGSVNRFYTATERTHLATVEAGADVTANAQVTVISPVAQVIYQNYDGSLKPNQTWALLTPSIKQNNVDIRGNNDVSIDLIPNANFTASVNATNGDPNKNRIAITVAAPGNLRFNVSVGTRTDGPFAIPFTLIRDDPPSGGGSGSSGTSSASDSSFPTLASSSYNQITRQNAGELPMSIVVAAGQTINYSLAATYQYYFTAYSGPVEAERTLKIKVGYRVAGTTGLFTFGPEFIGYESVWNRNDSYGDPGMVNATGAFTGLAAGTYEIGFFAALNLTSANGEMTIIDGTAEAGAV